MDEKDLYVQKMQAQLDQLQAEADKLKAQATEASADAQLKMLQQYDSIEKQIDDGKAKLSAVASATGDGWHSVKQEMDTAWNSIKAAFKTSTD